MNKPATGRSASSLDVPAKDNKIVVDLDDLNKLAYDGQNVVLEPEAERALISLLRLQEEVDRAIDRAKELVKKNALEHNPNFKSVQGDKLKIGFQFFGSRYAIDEANVKGLPRSLYNINKTYTPVSTEVDKYAKKHGKLPLGIIERDRTKSITIKKIEDFKEGE